VGPVTPTFVSAQGIPGRLQSGAPPSPAHPSPSSPITEQVRALLAAHGKSSQAWVPGTMRERLVGLLRDQFQRCFLAPPKITVPPGATVTITIRFASPEGALDGLPTLQTPPSDAGSRIFADAAIRAINRCAPFRIPKDFAANFSEWRSTIFLVDLSNFVAKSAR
jgi:colicin import membrane protein